MRVFYFLFFILYLSNLPTQCSAEDEFVDPLDMLNYDRATKSMKKTKTKTTSEHIQNDRCTVFLSRFINILLKNTGLSSLNYNPSDNNNEVLEKYVSVNLSGRDLQSLINMARKKDIDYMEIDRILNVMFTPIEKSSFGFKTTNSYIEIDQAKEMLYWLLVGSVVIILLYVIFKNIRYVSGITLLVLVIFSLAFASTWYTMYTKAEINRSVHLEYMPANCYKKTGGWLAFSWFKNNDLEECKRYKEAIHLDPKYSIAVTEVLAEMFTKIMVKPIETLGESIYMFNKSVLKDFPVWAQIILIPILIIVVIKTLLLSCALLVGKHLSMKSIFGYGGTSIGSGSTNNERPNTNNGTDSHYVMASSRHTVAQIPEVPKINFNINLFNPSSNTDNRKAMAENSFSFDNDFKINYKKESNLMSMLRNKDIDSVDSKNCKKKLRHRTLSM